MKQSITLLILFIGIKVLAQQVQFQDQIIFSQTTGINSVNSLEYGDINNDGHIDLLIARATTGNQRTVVWQENLGNGSFGTQITIRTSSGGANELKGAKFIDANQDGNLDVIVAENTGENMILYYGDGNGNFPNQFLLDVFTFTPSAFGVVDFNNDGMDDIVMAEPGLFAQVYWYENTGGGNFNPAVSIALTSGDVQDIEFGLVDNDSHIDIIMPVIGSTAQSIQWIKGNGNGGTNDPIQNAATNLNAPTEIVFEDLDNDGNKDLAYISFFGDSFSWLSGDGTGNFSIEQNITSIDAPSGLSFGDINQDGFGDLTYCLSGAFDRVNLLTNNNGNFTNSIISEIPDNPLYSVIVDIDNDTDLDVISLAANDYELTWHEASITTNSGPEVYFSEYVEGGGTNKALEIANFTGDVVDLSNYTVRLAFNGNSFGSDIAFPTNSSINDGDVYVIANTGLSSSCQSEQDFVSNAMTSFNGNDAIGLFKNGMLIDIIGTEGNSNNFAQNITLVRKSSVSNPNTTFDINEWDSYAQDDCSNLGSHTQTLSNENFTFLNVQIYPNPVSDYLLIKSTQKIKLIEIHSLNGQKLISYKNQNSIDITSLANGIYILNVTDNSNRIQNIKFIKE